MLIESLTHPAPEALLAFLRAHLHARVTLHAHRLHPGGQLEQWLGRPRRSGHP